jgi:hypothetical protein
MSTSKRNLYGYLFFFTIFHLLYPHQIIVDMNLISTEKIAEKNIFIEFTGTSHSSYSIRGDHMG